MIVGRRRETIQVRRQSTDCGCCCRRQWWSGRRICLNWRCTPPWIHPQNGWDAVEKQTRLKFAWTNSVVVCPKFGSTITVQIVFNSCWVLITRVLRELWSFFALWVWQPGIVVFELQFVYSLPSFNQATDATKETIWYIPVCLLSWSSFTQYSWYAFHFPHKLQ